MTEQEILLEQYKVFIKTADDLTGRRLAANNFYLTILLSLFTIAGFLNTKEINGIFDNYIILVLISILGLFLSVIWYMSIESFKLLNMAKFKVIHEMEQNLNYPCFDKEWYFRKNNDTKSDSYPRFTQIEKFVPVIMGTMYFSILAISVFFKYTT